MQICRNPDLYHTCYGLAGLAIAQSYNTKKTEIVGGEKNALVAFLFLQLFIKIEFLERCSSVVQCLYGCGAESQIVLFSIKWRQLEIFV